MDFAAERNRLLAIATAVIDEALPREGERPAVLSAAMRHAVGKGGKRLRPILCLAAAEAAGGRAEDARFAAAAIELLHNYTLVHDDLPAMDNDTARRGEPSVWAKFGEADAILAGDALQALAFATAAKSPVNAQAVVAVLAGKAFGVVAGQVEDVATGEKDVRFVYEHKTADLFVAAAAMGALCAGAPEMVKNFLVSFALNLGLAFQYEDDVIDGDSPLGAAEAARLAAEATAAAIAALDSVPGDTSFLREFAASLLGRAV